MITTTLLEYTADWTIGDRAIVEVRDIGLGVTEIRVGEATKLYSGVRSSRPLAEQLNEVDGDGSYRFIETCGMVAIEKRRALNAGEREEVEGQQTEAGMILRRVPEELMMLAA